MFARLAILCFLLCATGTATACMCYSDERWLAGLEAQGFPTDADIFHGKVERWISEREVDVRVIEAFSGGRETKRLIALNGTSCRLSGFPDKDAIYLPSKEGRSGSLSTGGLVAECSLRVARPEIVDRLRAIAKRSNKVDVVARNARVEAAVVQRAAEEKILRTHKGERLFEPAKEAALSQPLKDQLSYVRANKATLGVQAVHLNRRAIDAPVTVFVIDGKEYRFVGNVTTKRPPPQMGKSARETAYWAVTDTWDGHTASGDRAKITRDIWGMSGQIDASGRRFHFNSRGESGFIHEVNPTLIAEREADEKRAREAREKVAREAVGQRAQFPANLSTVRPVVPTAAPQVLSNAQPCAEKTRFLSGLDEAERYPQSAQLRSYISELRGTVKAEMVELQC
jgi:hypothetical protein